MPDVDLGAGTNLIVYAVGSLEASSLTFYTQAIDGLGGEPTVVNTGDTAVESGVSLAAIVLGLAAGGLGLSGTGLLLARRRVG